MNHMNRVILAMAIVAVGCTPRVHRAYQLSMAGVASVASVCDGMQTAANLGMDDSTVESNPFLGSAHPGNLLIGGTVALRILAAAAIIELPRDRIPDIYKDALITILAVVEAGAVTSNALLVDHGARCGY